MNANIAEPLLSLAVPIDDLTPDEDTPRRGDIPAIAKSYARFGQRKPIVAKADGTVTSGNHQLAAARSLGWDHIAVIFVDDSDAEARAFAVADNRTSELGHTDTDALREYLREVDLSDESLIEAISYSTDELDRLLTSIGTEHFAGMLDDISGGGAGPRVFEGSGMPKQPQFEGLVAFQVMVTPDQRRDMMAVLKADVDSGLASTPGDALALRLAP